jgi:hypothetical protein
MIFTADEIKEAEYRAEQAQAQVDIQIEMILRMRHSGLLTRVAEDTLNAMYEIRDQTKLRLSRMKATVKIKPQTETGWSAAESDSRLP